MVAPHEIAVPPGGWTVEDLDSWPESHVRYELTDGALTVTPTRSGLHQAVTGMVGSVLSELAPTEVAVTQAVEIRFGRQLTRVPDVLVLSCTDPARHWFAPTEVRLAIEIESPGSHTDDRVTKSAIYARYGIPHFWRVELGPIRVRTHRIGPGDTYVEAASDGERLRVDAPFPVDVALSDLLPRWAR